ncbi:U-box domain-containing protein 15-like [Hibiscus syriacus]|uniref:U-box domain-containing protein 15-like n=1 Tax=Hibiscus syriacus TaxID=106335 RepID=A0A6A3CVH5_HIBSY|nr:stemmadenine O-acetyltransferase-like [Hibiscus syriacus]KAE8731422.1 U-box domain-containing protein 15-like [Hibiscus syriacus]
MVMEVEIVSKELIKPTSPTPHHLRTHMLSFLDQFLPPIYVPMVLFYTNQEASISSADIIANNSRRAQFLKQSLSETLTLFYPFAGRIKDHLSIDCNDEGAYCVEARVNCSLCEFLELTDSSNVPLLLPAESSWTTPSAGGCVAMIQVTTFSCGGIVIGACISHMIADGTAVTTFLRSWAAMSRNSGEETAYPNFDASCVFPQNVAYPREATLSALITPFLRKGICRTMRVVFDASAIASLKAKATSSSASDPTRVEVVSALLSKCIMAAFKTKSDIQKSTLITHAVNLRQRAVPPIPKQSMGNFLCMVAALVMTDETKLDKLVCHLRKAIRKADGDFVAALQGDDGCLTFCEHIKEIGNVSCGEAGEIDNISFTSWCNFGVYEIDYGWGKPTWVTCTASTESETVFMNSVVLMDTKMGNGIEALVYLNEQHMAMLEQNEELLAIATVEQSPMN